ncbi:MAG: hypothetical protein M5U31_08680 [Acidimicrobiia bacterium]|nr:hypothetical protein [Acidimicrobiia bacterium]
MPVRVEGIDDATAVAPGYERTCALLEVGTVSCWGGTLDDSVYGDYDASERPPLPLGPEPLEGITDATAISANGDEYQGWCVLLGDGTVSCWQPAYSADAVELDGGDWFGTVDNITHATAVSVGGSHACALLEDGAVACWGTDSVDELGDGPNVADRPTPTMAPPVSWRSRPVPTAAGVSSSTTAACPVGGVAAGYTKEGGLIDSQESVPVPGITNATAISVAKFISYDRSCALLEDGTVTCWKRYDNVLPEPVEGITDATALALGASHSCALLEDGTVSCWGTNYQGELGDGTTHGSDVPVPVEGIVDATAISAGSHFSCAIVEDGAVSCWGSNNSGELGDGTTQDSDVPVPVKGIVDATVISAGYDSLAGYDSSCAIVEDGAVSCWGGSLDRRVEPYVLPGIANATALALGGRHSCALLEDRTVSCWGANYQGQLGRVTPHNRGVVFEDVGPGAVEGLHDVVAISANGDSTCALIEDGSVSCWGLI